MRKFIALMCVMLACSPVLAQDKAAGKKAPAPPPKMTPEQKKEALAAACKKEADSLKLTGEPLQSFMNGCLGEPAAK